MARRDDDLDDVRAGLEEQMLRELKADFDDLELSLEERRRITRNTSRR
ncbi:MAG: hypothetical protein L0271_12260 [Gemmatimonadetes bacterium]|nr:hypothetical protein [Gemmatimonadota bacterium]